MAERDPIELSGGATTASGPSKLLTLLVAANLLVTTTAVVLVFLGFGPAAAPTDGEQGDVVEAEAEDLPPAIYESMDKPIVANFPSNGRDRYLQLVVQFMTRSDQTVLDVRNHMPAIIDAIYVLLGQTEFDDLRTIDGRETLRDEVLGLTQTILERHTGEPGVEQVFFTTYLFQI